MNRKKLELTFIWWNKLEPLQWNAQTHKRKHNETLTKYKPYGKNIWHRMYMYVEHERSKPEHVSRYQAYMCTKHECSKLEYEMNLTVIDKA